ncbi:MAG TPA: recombination mediator RecR [Verrucomicrobiae bacterium]
MSALPEPINQLVASLSKLPGIGPRSAERIALHLVQSEKEVVQRLAENVLAAREKIQLCSVCGGLTETQPCTYCSDNRRDASLICIVERPVDVMSIEKSGVFRGTYHVLGGKISPLNGVEPEDLRITELEKRCEGDAVKEIIIALPSDVEGDATSFYINKLLSPRGIRVTRIAHGLPVGSGLEFADELTLSRALEGRRQF